MRLSNRQTLFTAIASTRQHRRFRRKPFLLYEASASCQPERKMPKRRGGQKSERARKGSAEPDAEHSGSEDEPLGEPPLDTPYTRLAEAEALEVKIGADAELARRRLQTGDEGLLPGPDLDAVKFPRTQIHVMLKGMGSRIN